MKVTKQMKYEEEEEVLKETGIMFIVFKWIKKKGF